MLKSAASGAILGRLAGAISGPTRSLNALNSFGYKLELTALSQGALWTFAGMTGSTFPSFVYGEAITIPGISTAYQWVEGLK
jgi:hypothetical protein